MGHENKEKKKDFFNAADSRAQNVQMVKGSENFSLSLANLIANWLKFRQQNLNCESIIQSSTTLSILSYSSTHNGLMLTINVLPDSEY